MTPEQLSAHGVAAEAWIERVLGRHLSAGTYTETFTGMNTPLIFLSSPVVTAVPSVVVNFENQVTRMTTQDGRYRFTADGKLYIGSSGFWNQMPGWRPGVDNIQVTYQSAGLEQTVIDLLIGSVMNWWHDRAGKSTVAIKEQIMSYSYELPTNATGIPAPVMTLLYPYFRQGVA